MLTELKAYSAWTSAPVLPLSPTGRAETDLVQIRNIEGLDPVPASVNMTAYGAIDGEAYIDSNVLSRNIVLTVHPNPDWSTWSYEALRRLLYAYFMPKQPTRLVFHSDDMVPVEIFGIVESVLVNPFSNDPELIISILCPDPYFTALDPEVITGESCLPDDLVMENIDYDGNIAAGIYLKVISDEVNPDPISIGVQVGDPAVSYFEVLSLVNSENYFEVSSVPRQKYVQSVDTETGVITSLLSRVTVREGSRWPILQPGENSFCVITETDVYTWELTYFERFGGL